MRKLSSILPSNSRIKNVDISASPPRRRGAYSAYSKGSERLEKPGQIKMDRVNFSNEAKEVSRSTSEPSERTEDIYRRMQGIGYLNSRK